MPSLCKDKFAFEIETCGKNRRRIRISSMKRSILKLADHLFGPTLCAVMSALNPKSRNNPSGALITLRQPKKILVVRPGGIGDMVLLLPCLKALSVQYPTARIDVVCERRNFEVLKLAGINCSFLPYDGNPATFLYKLSIEKYDIAVDSEQFHNFSAVFTFLSRAGIRIGFNINPRRNPLYTHLVNYDLDGAEPVQFAKLLAPLGINVTSSHKGMLNAASLELSNDIAKELHYLGNFAAINPCGSTSYKAWQNEKYIELITRLNRDHGLSVVLLGGDDEAALCNSIVDTARISSGKVTSFAGRLSLKDSAAVMAKSQLFIGVDSGLAHLATALDVPSVTLFSSTNPDKWAFRDTRHVIVHNPLPCSPCAIFGYNKPCNTITCMTSITVDSIMKVIKKIIEDNEGSKT